MIPEDFQRHRKEMINNPVGFVQEYLMPIKKKRGRPKMIEIFFYDPYKWNGITWDGKTLTIVGTIIK